MPPQTRRILVTVKAYPAPSRKYIETVCVAGITADDKKWARLYPVPFRDLEYKKRFKKYDLIEARIEKVSRDHRPESYKIDADSIKVIGHLDSSKGWAKRKEYVLPTVSNSMCEIERRSETEGVSLGAFKPAPPVTFSWEPAPKQWKAGSEERYGQLSLFNPQKKVLEKIPYLFRYQYRCLNEPVCSGHNQCIIDWEIGEAFRSWKQQRYHTDERTLEMIQQKWQAKMFGDDKDTHLFVGNQHRFKTFMVLGVFWPPKDTKHE